MCREWEKGLSNLISIWLENMIFYNWILIMFLFISTGTYFKLLDLEISGDLEMIGDVICIYMFIYICVCVYIYIYGYNSFFSQRVSLVPLHPEMFTNIYIWGQAIFSHINYFLNKGRIFKPGIQFWHKMFTLKSYNLSIETHFLYGSLWTHPVESPVHSESSVM